MGTPKGSFNRSGNGGRPANDPVTSFWAKTVKVADDAYSDHVLWWKPLDGRQPYMSVDNQDRNARQVAFKYILARDIEWGTLVAGCREQCVDPRCLKVIPKSERPLKCWPCLKHERQEGWAIEINGKEFCRLGSQYWTLFQGHRKQITWLLNEARVPHAEWDRWEPKLMNELAEYPDMIRQAATERKASYLRERKRKKQEPKAFIIDRYQGVFDDPSRLLDEWDIPEE